MTTEARRYRFPPLERRGLIAGFGGGQLVVLAAGAVVALLVLRTAPSGTAVIGATLVLAVAAASACWTVAGRAPIGWVPIAGAWLWQRMVHSQSGVAANDAPVVGTTVAGPPRAAPPRVLAGVSVSAAPAVPGSPAMGVVRDVRAGTVAAMVAVHGRSFSLLDPGEKERRLAGWGAVLAGLCRDGSPVHRLQWVERAIPAASDGLWHYLDESGAGGGRSRESYAELITDAGPAGQSHQLLLVLAINPRRAGRAMRAFGRGHTAACGLLRRELRLLQGQLRSAELVAGKVLTERDVASALRGAVDLAAGQGTTPIDVAGAQRLARRCRPEAAWPMATDEGWAVCRTDNAWHATYWVSEWPRVEVGPDFLSPLLLSPTARRSASVVMAPISPAQAVREVEAARTADIADEQLRQRAGFLHTARRQREADGVIRRESELADGHAEYRFSGYVTVSATDRSGLDLACAEIELSARQSGLELRRLYGQQADAFTWTLPLARGLR